MTSRAISLRLRFTALALASLALLSAQTAKSLPAHNVPKAVEGAQDLGSVDPTREINLTVVLQPHNSAAYDQAVQALYDPASPT